MNASPKQSAAATQYCTFRVGHLHLGVDVRHVQEVLHMQEVTPVPLAPAVVEGLINLRGQIVTALNMRRRLGLSPQPEGDQSINMVIFTEHGAVGLLIDEIGEVLDGEGGFLEDLPDNVAHAHRELIQGICKWGDRLVMVLDVERTVALAGLAT
jgi:purine-binding chemotaxis protein CheW